MTCAENPPLSAKGLDSIRIQRQNPLELPGWDERMAVLPGAGIFHSAGWVAVLRDTYGFAPVYLLAGTESNLSAVLPVMEVASWLTGRRGVSLPFTDHCPPAGRSEAACRAVIEGVKDFGRTRGWKYVEYRGGQKFFEGVNPSLSFFGHRLNLLAGADVLFSRFSSSVRRAIRKAEKSGLTVSIARDEAAVRDYYSLHCKTRRRHGLPPQPLAFFLNIHRRILSQNMGVVVFAKVKERTVASAMFFYFGDQAIYKFGASDPAFQDSRANNLVMWEGIRSLARQGRKVLDFGRTSPSNEGLRRFKLGWGTEEYPIEYFKFDLRRNAFVADRDNSSGWHTHVFRTMPGFLARFAGAFLYKHIA